MILTTPDPTVPNPNNAIFNFSFYVPPFVLFEKTNVLLKTLDDSIV